MEHAVKPNDTIIVSFDGGAKPKKFVIKRMSVEPWVCLQEVWE